MHTQYCKVCTWVLLFFHSTNPLGLVAYFSDMVLITFWPVIMLNLWHVHVICPCILPNLWHIGVIYCYIVLLDIHGLVILVTVVVTMFIIIAKSYVCAMVHVHVCLWII